MHLCRQNASLSSEIAFDLFYSYILIFFTSAKEVMFLPEFVCLSVCVCVSKITQKVMTDFSEIFWECREWHKLPVIQFWG